MASRITQERVEALRQGGNTQKLRMTQETVETIFSPTNVQNLRMTQEVIEVIYIPGAGCLWNPLNITY